MQASNSLLAVVTVGALSNPLAHAHARTHARTHAPRNAMQCRSKSRRTTSLTLLSASAWAVARCPRSSTSTANPLDPARLVGRSVGWLVGWFVGWLVDWLIGLTFGAAIRSAHASVRCCSWPACFALTDFIHPIAALRCVALRCMGAGRQVGPASEALSALLAKDLEDSVQHLDDIPYDVYGH